MKVLTLLLALAGLGLAPLAARAYPMYPAAASPAGVTRMQAAQVALRAVGGGRVTSVQYENDVRPYWQVEIYQPRVQWEVNVSARTGHVLSIVRQGDN
jgi:hypothetical protein